MASPFSTIEELNSAIDGPTEGAIYTFANTPAINEIALLVAVGLLSLIAADHRQITSSPQDRKTARPSGVSGWPAI